MTKHRPEVEHAFSQFHHGDEILAGLRGSTLDKPCTKELLVELLTDMRALAVREFRLTRAIKPFFTLMCSSDVAFRSPDGRPFTPPPNTTGIVRIPALFSSDLEKQALLAGVRSLADHGRAVAAIHLGEVWVVSSGKHQPGETHEQVAARMGVSADAPVRDHPERQEGVSLVAQSTLWRPQVQAWFAPIKRPRGARPYLAEWTPFAQASGSLADLLPYLHEMQ